VTFRIRRQTSRFQERSDLWLVELLAVDNFHRVGDVVYQQRGYMYQYKQVAIPNNASPDQRQQALDRMGQEGWDLKTVHTPPGSRSEILVFCKQMAQESVSPPGSGPRSLNG